MGIYISVIHCFLRDCLRLNLLPYTLEYAGGTAVRSNEFHIVLKRSDYVLSDSALRQEQILKTNKITEMTKGRKGLTEFIERYKSVYIYGSPECARFLMRNTIEQYGKIAGLVISEGFEKEALNCRYIICRKLRLLLMRYYFSHE